MTVYIYGEGAVWRLDAAAQRAVASGANWYDVAKQTKAEQNSLRRRGHGWRNLPSVLYASNDEKYGARLGTIDSRNAPLLHYDDPKSIREACKDAIKHKNPRVPDRARRSPEWRRSGG